jgi:membrane associated rhomboid family serine protease
VAVDTCYRHPNRETGVRCSNCERPICPDCMTSTPVGMRCPECARQRTQVRTMRSMTGEPRLTYVLIGVCVLAFLGESFSGGGIGGSGTLFNDGALYRGAIQEGEYWRLVTSGFLHDGLPHLLFNMLGLYILGSILEPAIGTPRFAVIYFVSLLTGSFGALLQEDVGATVGASGAVFGLMGATAIVMWNRGLNIMESGLGFWIILNLVISFFPGLNISWGGPIGGLIGGTLCALALVELRQRTRIPELAAVLLCVALGAAAVAGALTLEPPVQPF